MSFQLGFCILDEGGRSFHQHGNVNENVLESNFVALFVGTISSMTDRRLLGM